MSDKPAKWHEIINGAGEPAALTFLDLYREYADALRQKEAEKRRQQYWPFAGE